MASTYGKYHLGWQILTYYFHSFIQDLIDYFFSFLSKWKTKGEGGNPYKNKMRKHKFPASDENKPGPDTQFLWNKVEDYKS